MAVRYILLLILSVSSSFSSKECKYDDSSTSLSDIIKRCNASKSIEINGTIDLKDHEQSALEFLKEKETIKMPLIFSHLKTKRIEFTQKVTIEGDFIVRGNEHLETIQMKNLVLINGGNFIIENNPRLLNITFPKAAEIITKNFRIEGNPLLGRKYLKILKKMGKGNVSIQEHGECIPWNGTAMKDVKELDGCEIATKGLIFEKAASQTKTWNPIDLRTVKGCVSIKGTNLKSVHFLRNTRILCNAMSEVSDNPLLCDDVKYLSTKKFSLKNNCHGTCRNIAELEQGKPCTTLDSDLLVTSSTPASIFKGAKNLKTINGHVKIIGTELENIDFLSNLQYIGYDSVGPVLVIMKNHRLKSLNLEKLMMVFSGVLERIYIRENGRFRLTGEQYKGLLKMVVDENSVDVDVENLPQEEIGWKERRVKRKRAKIHWMTKEIEMTPTILWVIIIFASVVLLLETVAFVVRTCSEDEEFASAEMTGRRQKRKKTKSRSNSKSGLKKIVSGSVRSKASRKQLDSLKKAQKDIGSQKSSPASKQSGKQQMSSPSATGKEMNSKTSKKEESGGGTSNVSSRNNSNDASKLSKASGKDANIGDKKMNDGGKEVKVSEKEKKKEQNGGSQRKGKSKTDKEKKASGSKKDQKKETSDKEKNKDGGKGKEAEKAAKEKQ